MENAFEILVIILSLLLGFALILGIVAVVFVLKLIKELRQIAEKGNVIAQKAESITSNLASGVITSRFLKAVASLAAAARKFK